MSAGLIGAIKQIIEATSAPNWRMNDGELSTRWYPLGYELHAGGLGRITIKVAPHALTCFACHTIAAGHLYIACIHDDRRRIETAYCLEHAPRQIELSHLLKCTYADSSGP